MKRKDSQWLSFLKENLIILLIVCVAAWLRVWQLDTHGILFSDAGRDLLVAYESVQDKTLPLLGIPSSVPRFKQGPVSIWIEMAVISIAGPDTLAQSLVFAIISILAVIAVYEFACIYASKKHALVAAALLATSPLAVASGRVPYHTNPIPLATVLYLFTLMLLWQNKKFSPFFAGLAFAFLFQFELAVAPLFLLIPFVIWYRKFKIEKNIFIHTAAGLALGLLPQIIFDLTHKFAQIGVFFVWMGHKVIEFVSFKGGGGVHFEKYFQSFNTFGGRIFSTDYWIISVLILVLVLLGFYFALKQLRKKTINPAWLIVELAILLLVGGYFVHGAPSEAYFPPFFVLLPLHLTFTIFALPKVARYSVLVFVAYLFVWNTISINSHSFFVGNPQKFSYGASTSEIRSILQLVDQKSGGNYNLSTLDRADNIFPSHFDNYRWVALEQGLAQPTSNGKTFYIVSLKTAPRSTPYIFRDFTHTRVYWFPSALPLEP